MLYGENAKTVSSLSLSLHHLLRKGDASGVEDNLSWAERTEMVSGRMRNEAELNIENKRYSLDTALYRREKTRK